MTQQFIVSVPGRSQPVCIEADAIERDDLNDAGVAFRKGGEVVARLPAVDLAARADCLPEFPDLSQFKPVAPDLVFLGEPGQVLQQGEAIEPLPVRSSTAFCSSGTPAVWPLVSGFALGVIVGVGAVLSWAGAW